MRGIQVTHGMVLLEKVTKGFDIAVASMSKVCTSPEALCSCQHKLHICRMKCLSLLLPQHMALGVNTCLQRLYIHLSGAWVLILVCFRCRLAQLCSTKSSCAVGRSVCPVQRCRAEFQSIAALNPTLLLLMHSHCVCLGVCYSLIPIILPR